MAYTKTSPNLKSSVSRREDAHAPRSLFPRTAVIGAMAASASRTLASQISPPWTIWSLPWRKASTSGRKRPCVSEMRPTRTTHHSLAAIDLAPYSRHVRSNVTQHTSVDSRKEALRSRSVLPILLPKCGAQDAFLSSAPKITAEDHQCQAQPCQDRRNPHSCPKCQQIHARIDRVSHERI